MRFLLVTAFMVCVVSLSEQKKKVPLVPVLGGVALLFLITSKTIEGATEKTDCSGFPGNFLNWIMCLFKTKDSDDKTGYGTCPCFMSCSNGTKQSPSPQKCSSGKIVKNDGLCNDTVCTKDDFKDGSDSNCCIDHTPTSHSHPSPSPSHSHPSPSHSHPSS